MAANRTNMNKNNQGVFAKAVGGVVVCLFFSFYLFHRATKNKKDFQQLRGRVVAVETTSPQNHQNDPARYRYLTIEGYTKPFEIFIGKATGDFKPALEKIDALKPGDTVDVYYDENMYSEKDPVNRLAYFIDRKQEPFFIKGSWEKTLADFIAIGSLLLLIWVTVLKRRGKIS